MRTDRVSLSLQCARAQNTPSSYLSTSPHPRRKRWNYRSRCYSSQQLFARLTAGRGGRTVSFLLPRKGKHRVRRKMSLGPSKRCALLRCVAELCLWSLSAVRQISRINLRRFSATRQWVNKNHATRILIVSFIGARDFRSCMDWMLLAWTLPFELCQIVFSNMGRIGTTPIFRPCEQILSSLQLSMFKPPWNEIFFVYRDKRTFIR